MLGLCSWQENQQVSKHGIDVKFAKLMGASNQLPSSQILIEVQIFVAFWTIMGERSYKKMTKDSFTCVFEKLQ